MGKIPLRVVLDPIAACPELTSGSILTLAQIHQIIAAYRDMNINLEASIDVVQALAAQVQPPPIQPGSGQFTVAAGAITVTLA